MTDPAELTMRDRCTKHAIVLIRQVPNLRFYAITDKELTGIAALIATWQRRRKAEGKNFEPEKAVELLAELAKFVPSLVQERPADEPELVALWRDPVSGATPPNPWARGSINLTEQSWLSENVPQMAVYLKATANGVTHSYLQKQREEKESRAVLRKLSYGEKEHKDNPFHNSDLAARARFVKENHPATVEFYRHEATTPVELPWQGKGNLTETMLISKNAPELRELVRETAELEKVWCADELKVLDQTEAENLRKRQIATQLLNR